MTRLILPAILFFALPSFLMGQGITAPADSGRNEPPTSCTICAGAIWQNENDITFDDNNYASVQLEQYLFCFQATCYRSRYLICSDFNLNIPDDGNVSGIVITLLNRSQGSMIARDSTLRLAKAGSMVGVNKADTTPWTNSFTYRSYGGSSDTWGVSWTTDELNDPDFGIYYKVYNSGNSNGDFKVDQVQVTVFYDTPQGSFSQTSSPKKFSTFYEPSSASLSVHFIPGVLGLDHHFEVMDIRGTVFHKEELLRLEAYEEVLGGLHLAPGVYFLRFRTNESQYVLKFPVSN